MHILDFFRRVFGTTIPAEPAPKPARQNKVKPFNESLGSYVPPANVQPPPKPQQPKPSRKPRAKKKPAPKKK